MTPSAIQQVAQLVSAIKSHHEVLDNTAKRLRTPKILNAFDKWDHDSWCIAAVGDALVRLRLFTDQNFNLIETMSTIAVARYILELSVWLHLFKLNRDYGLVYYSQLLDTQLKYWKDYRTQVEREIVLLSNFEEKERKAQVDFLDQIKANIDKERQKHLQQISSNAVSEDIDKQASRRFSLFVEQAKVNGYGFQAHLVRINLLPQIEKSIEDVSSEKTAFDGKMSQNVMALIPKKWNWKQMAQKVGLTDEYDYIYTFSSKLLHATPASITTDQKNLEASEIVVFLKYIDVKISDVLDLASEYLLEPA